jgi:Right handed beta helix region
MPSACAPVPSDCGFPDGTNTGVPKGTTLLRVPDQVSSGPGWAFDSRDGAVEVTGNGAVLSGLYIPGNLDITASDVTIKDSRIVTAGDFAVSLRHTAGVTIEDSIIGGSNASTGRVGVAITDVYGDSDQMVIEDNNISDFKTGVQVSTGTVTGNYIHAPGYVAGDHTNGIFDAGSTQPLTIDHNTILNSFGQTDAISLDASVTGQKVANKTVENNLLAGGGYTIYGGASLSNTTSRIVIRDNRFSRLYYPWIGQYGMVTCFDSAGPGNVWSGNVWDGSRPTRTILLP